MNNRKRRGPSTDPCGTPHVMPSGYESLPQIETICVLFAKYD